MKKSFFLVILFAIILVSGCTMPESPTIHYPSPSGYVVDEAGVLSETTKGRLNEDLKAFDKQAQIAVVTVKTTQPLSIDEYSINLATQWGIGQAGKDNGILFIVATEDRKVKIEVGYGLEGTINDAKAGRILDNNVVPYLKDNNWDDGVLSGVNAIKEEIKKYE